jgi:hypothetical protein
LFAPYFAPLFGQRLDAFRDEFMRAPFDQLVGRALGDRNKFRIGKPSGFVANDFMIVVMALRSLLKGISATRGSVFSRSVRV